MNKPAFMKSAAPTALPNPDKLETIRAKMRDVRDLTLERQQCESRVEQIKASVLRITQGELPDLLNEAKIDTLGLEAEGNLPPYDLKLKPYYYANIKNDAPEAPEAYTWLEKEGHGDLIRRTYTIVFGKADGKAAKKFEEQLNKLKITYDVSFGVPWNTLTAFVKEQIEKYKIVPPLHLMNGKYGLVADIKPRKPAKVK